eukprot:15476763-Alexandrium_andersonii.AAC.1
MKSFSKYGGPSSAGMRMVAKSLSQESSAVVNCGRCLSVCCLENLDGDRWAGRTAPASRRLRFQADVVLLVDANGAQPGASSK